MNLDERYTLVETKTGGLMLDLVSGALLELNESGKAIWQLALAGQTEEAIAAALVTRHALELETARKHVRDTLRTSFEAVPEIPKSDFHYERNGDAYVFHFRGQGALVVDDRGERITLASAPEGVSLPYLLQAVAPKILALRGQAVLHASAVAMAEAGAEEKRVVAFSGLSGAGKTTTARALARAGGHLICEDKLLVQLRDTGAVVAPNAEKVVARWVETTAKDLAASKHATCASLDVAGGGETIPLVEIGFLDARQRTSGPYACRALSEIETAGAAFRHAFYGSDASPEWIRYLRTAAHLGQTVRGYELAMPDGLDRLADAAAKIIRGGSLRT
ncbi:MAG TPA: PqqD family peptide modification chaperone [Polyangia bacterium]|jgi:hypothetical protein